MVEHPLLSTYFLQKIGMCFLDAVYWYTDVLLNRFHCYGVKYVLMELLVAPNMPECMYFSKVLCAKGNCVFRALEFA